MDIALVDDKQYGMEQIQNSLPSDFSGETVWFSSAERFLAQPKIFDIVFLDYYLDEDGITGDTVIKDIRPKAKFIIGFSSIASGNEKLKKAGADHVVEKSSQTNNDALENILLEIIVKTEQ